MKAHAVHNQLEQCGRSKTIFANLRRLGALYCIPERDVMLYKTTCATCHPRVSPDASRSGYLYYHPKPIPLAKMDADKCAFCAIILQCCSQFTTWTKDVALVQITFSHKLDVQLCFKTTGSDSSASESEDDPDDENESGSEDELDDENDSGSEHTSESDYDLFDDYNEGCEDIHIQINSHGQFQTALDFDTLTIGLESQDTSSPFRKPSRMCRDPKDPSLYRKIKGWIDMCESHHTPCVNGQSTDTDFPRRLIRLPKDGNLSARLVEPEVPVQFAALSYCWGRTPQPSTTRANVLPRHSCLDTTMLPQTLQDAIFVTRSLGIEYLWIDSLCIVQDDIAEWALEAAKMAALYSKAHVVIIAASASDCSEGFLQHRQEPEVIHADLHNAEPIVVQARRVGGHSCDLKANKNNSPMFTRGWCMQERFLARRAIYFLPDEVRFECLKRHICECSALQDKLIGVEHSTNGSAAYRNLQSIRNPLRKFAFGEKKMIAIVEKSRGISQFAFGKKWAAIIEEYSGLKLTYSTDLLPALSGLVKSVEYLKPGVYMAGFWTKDLPYQLGWYTVRQSRHRIPTPDAPSYSWTASTGAVSFESDRAKRRNLAWANTLHGKLILRLRCLCSLDQPIIASRLLNDTSISIRGSYASGSKMIAELKSATKESPTCGSILSGHRCDPDYLCDSIHLDSEYQGFAECGDGPKITHDWSGTIVFALYDRSDYTTHDAIVALLLCPRDQGYGYVRFGVVTEVNPHWFARNSTEGMVRIF